MKKTKIIEKEYYKEQCDDVIMSKGCLQEVIDKIGELGKEKINW